MNNLPAELYYYWADVNNPEDLRVISIFLNKHYNMNKKFHLDITPDFLAWHYSNNSKLLTVRLKKNNVIIGFIGGSGSSMQFYRDNKKVINCSYFTVNYKYKKITKFLLKEFKEKCGCDFEYGYYLRNKILSKEFFSSVQTYRRVINLKRLLSSGYTKIEGDKNSVNLDEYTKQLRLKNNVDPNIRLSRPDDLERLYELYNNYTSRYNMYDILTVDEFKKKFMNDFVKTYVVMEDDLVVDFVSLFFMKEHENNNHDNYINRAVLLFYTSISETPYKLLDTALIIAKNNKSDIFIAYDNLENHVIIKDMNFDVGEKLYLSSYNFKPKNMNNTQIASLVYF